MVAQERLIKRLAYLSLLYVIWGDDIRSEALRLMMYQLNHHSVASERSQAAVSNHATDHRKH